MSADVQTTHSATGNSASLVVVLRGIEAKAKIIQENRTADADVLSEQVDRLFTLAEQTFIRHDLHGPLSRLEKIQKDASASCEGYLRRKDPQWDTRIEPVHELEVLVGGLIPLYEADAAYRSTHGNLKSYLENHVVTIVIGASIAAFSAGIGAVQVTYHLANLETVRSEELKRLQKIAEEVEKAPEKIRNLEAEVTSLREGAKQAATLSACGSGARVWILSMVSQEDRRAQEAVKLLNSKGCVATGPAVPPRSAQVTSSVLKYFYEDDVQQAAAMAGELDATLGMWISPKFERGFTQARKPGEYELWMATE